jgi:hypothetical protein
MFYAFVIIVAALGVAIYLTVVLRAVPGAVDERLGRLEDLPSNLGEWVEEADAPAAIAEGLVRERRVLLESGKGLFGRDQLVEQVRYREGSGGKIVGVEPERRWSRKRTRV